MFIIAEIAQAHEGSLGIAHSYIDALAETGVDAIKWQTHIAEAESSEFEPFRVNFSYEDSTRFDYWKRMEFSESEWAGLKKHCDEKNMEFLSSPFSVAAVDLLERVGVKRYKIGSGEMQNYLMLERIAKTGKPIILSSGMSDWDELNKTIEFLKQFGNELSLLQCTTAYPTAPEQWGLHVIQEMKARFDMKIGLSDHSATTYAGLAAATLGADILEFHVVFDHRMFGPDAKASLTIDQVRDMVKGIRMINKSMTSGYSKERTEGYDELRQIFGKSIAVNKALSKGHVLSLADLESKKPAGKGIPASEYHNVIGKTLTANLAKWDFLNYKNIS